MRKRFLHLLLVLAVVASLAGVIYYAVRGRGDRIERYSSAGRPPRIRPDYADCVIPPNIAPLNFYVAEPASRYYVEVYSTNGEKIKLSARGPRITIPLRAWRRLLEQNRGEQLCFDVYGKKPDGSWRRFDSVTNLIAQEEIDGYLAYRLMHTAYNLWGEMGIYQRDLESYDESVVLHYESFGKGCTNCHTFLNNNADSMMLHFRSGPEAYGSGMLLIRDGVAAKVDTRTEFFPMSAAYASWHPSGQVLAFSMNKVRQFFHSSRAEIRDVCNLESDLAIYLLETNTVTSTASITDPDTIESYPGWSADGRWLYFCSAPILWSDRETVPPEHYDQVRYSLMRISYDLATGGWGRVQTVLPSAETGLSILQPKASPDGRFLLFSMCDHGVFPIYQSSTDLYLMDLQTGQRRRLACNSEQSDSWHSWSSNSRWVVFSSKRDDGLFARPYFTYIDQSGRSHKPFVLPQKDPTFYESLVKTYNMPELIREPCAITGEELARVIRSSEWVQGSPPVTAATPRGAPPAARRPGFDRRDETPDNE